MHRMRSLVVLAGLIFLLKQISATQPREIQIDIRVDHWAADSKLDLGIGGGCGRTPFARFLRWYTPS